MVVPWFFTKSAADFHFFHKLSSLKAGLFIAFFKTGFSLCLSMLFTSIFNFIYCRESLKIIIIIHKKVQNAGRAPRSISLEAELLFCIETGLYENFVCNLLTKMYHFSCSFSLFNNNLFCCGSKICMALQKIAQKCISEKAKVFNLHEKEAQGKQWRNGGYDAEPAAVSDSCRASAGVHQAESKSVVDPKRRSTARVVIAGVVV